MLPDRSLLTGQKLVENAKIEKYKCDIIIIFEQNKLKRSFFDANIALEKYSMSQILIKCTP